MDISSCCGAKIQLIDHYKDTVCSACGRYSESIVRGEPLMYGPVKPGGKIEMPERIEDWREKILFVKKKKAIDKDIHNHPLGAGFAHKDTKDNG